jgi:hypothetical protein
VQLREGGSLMADEDRQPRIKYRRFTLGRAGRDFVTPEDRAVSIGMGILPPEAERPDELERAMLDDGIIVPAAAKPPMQVGDLTTSSGRLTSGAAPPPAQPTPGAVLPGVKVRPLVWKLHRNPRQKSEARTPIGCWTVWEIDGSGYCYGPNDIAAELCAGGLEGAKAAAEQQYMALALSLLDLPTDDEIAAQVLAENRALDERMGDQ